MKKYLKYIPQLDIKGIEEKCNICGKNLYQGIYNNSISKFCATKNCINISVNKLKGD